MKTKLLLLIFFGLNFLSFGQECGTISPVNYQTYERTKQERGYDINSNTVYSDISSNIEKTIETVTIPAGTYYLHINDGNETYIHQLIITH